MQAEVRVVDDEIRISVGCTIEEDAQFRIAILGIIYLLCEGLFSSAGWCLLEQQAF